MHTRTHRSRSRLVMPPRHLAVALGALACGLGAGTSTLARAAPAPKHGAAPHLMKVALAGSEHLQAYGVPYSPASASASGSPPPPRLQPTAAYPTPLHFHPPAHLDLPTSPVSLAEAALAGAMEAAARARLGPGACQDVPVPFSSCNFSCTLCEATVGGIVKVTCTEPKTGKVGLGENTNATIALRQALTSITLLLDVGPGHTDCTCIPPQERIESAGCTLLGSFCDYVPSAEGAVLVLMRAKAWDKAAPQYIGSSKGWSQPSDGFNASAPSSPYDSTLAAVRAMRAANPTRKCNPGKVAPLVLIPGLTSSAINYKLTSSPPPAWAFWCEHTTDGWVPLWPLTKDVTGSAFKFACWTANAQVKFDPVTQSFSPEREGEVTTTIDFGSPGGIPGFQGVASLYEFSGWTMGTDLFFAPFDWRLPSVSQAQFFNGTQQLVEKVYTSLNETKVALWAFSFGPQYALSFLHRMTQDWKDKHIDMFVATSPVWSGAPAALITYASGYSGGGGGPVPNLPKQCKAFTTATGVCYTGVPAAVVRGTIADCCTASAARGSKESLHLFNYFAHNTTCFVLGGYVGTANCAGALGYIDPNNTATTHAATGTGTDTVTGTGMLAATSTAKAKGVVAAATHGGGYGYGDVPLTPELTKVIARASPSLMWAFPRAGTANTTYTRAEPVLITKTKNYTAFDVEELLRDLGMGKVEVAQHAFLQAEPDLAGFAAPGVDTLVTFGTKTPTSSAAIYAKDFFSKAETNLPTGYLKEDGDGLVPTRGSLRSHEWAAAQAALGRQLRHTPYPLQPHAACFGSGGDSDMVKAETQCYTDVLAHLQHTGAQP